MLYQECDREGSLLLPSSQLRMPTGSFLSGSAAEPGGARVTNPQFPGAAQLPKGSSSKPGLTPVPCPQLEDHQASGIWGITAELTLHCLPENFNTQHFLTALHIPPAVHFSRRHQSCLYYQNFLKHVVPHSIGPFNQTIKRTDIKFSKYPSFWF